MKIIAFISIWVVALAVSTCRSEPAGISSDKTEDNFINPGSETGPETWWHWLNGNITREGITLDLEELKDKGYRGATAFSIGHSIHSNYQKGPVPYMSSEWYELFNYAVEEADRLGLKLTLNPP